MTQEKPRLEEQVVNRAAELGLSSQLDAVDNLDINIRANLWEIAQGEANSISIVGKGLVVQKDIRLDSITLETDDVAIDTLSAISGKLILNQPLNATARVTMTEADMNCALNSEYLRRQLQDFELGIDAQVGNLEIQQLEIHLPGAGKMVFSGKALLREQDETRTVEFNAVVLPRTRLQPVMVEAFHCSDGESISLELAVALLQRVQELTNISYFDLETMAFRIRDLEVQEGRILLQTEAQVREIPKA